MFQIEAVPGWTNRAPREDTVVRVGDWGCDVKNEGELGNPMPYTFELLFSGVRRILVLHLPRILSGSN